MISLKELVPSQEWEEYIIGAKEIVVTLFDTILQIAVGVTLVGLLARISPISYV